MLMGTKKLNKDQAWWLMPVIPALWEAKVDRQITLGQAFETSLVNMAKSHLY